MNNPNVITWINLPSVRDDRGVLTSVEAKDTIPFEVKRVFFMHHVRSDRGGHAHVDTDQLVVAVAGNFKMELTDTGERKSMWRLDDPCKGLYIPRMTFLDITEFSTDAVCLVLASTHYDMNKSLRSWNEFKIQIASG